MEKIIKNHKYLRCIPALLWMILIFYLSSGQTDAVAGNNTQRFLILKSLHIVEYFILFFLLNLAINSPKKSLLFAYIFALSDELHQSFVPGRSALLRDTYIDLTGIILAYIITALTVKRHRSSII